MWNSEKIVKKKFKFCFMGDSSVYRVVQGERCKKDIILRVLLLCMVPCGKVRNFFKRIVTSYYITVASSMYGSWN